MRQRKTFRPLVGEPLEDRTVPSGLDVGGGWLSGLIGLGPSTQTKAVEQAFHTFERTYTDDVFNVLYGTGGPSANRTAFDAKVGTDLTSLEASIQTALGSSNATLNTTIDTALTGTASSSLQSQLNAIATPAAGHGHFSSGGPWRFVGQGEYDIAKAEHSAVQQVQTATAPTNAVTASTVETALQTVNKAFDAFRTSYNNDLKTILYGAGGPSTTTRAAFDAQVAADVGALTTKVTGALSTLPSTLSASLTATLTADLQTPASGATGASLQEKLAALATPSSNYFSKVWFKINSNWTTQSGRFRLNSDLLSAVKAYNTSLPTV